jgi:hypothetical protein
MQPSVLIKKGVALMSGIGIITNPHSKLNKRNPTRQELLGYILGEHGRLEITNSLEDLGRAAQEFKKRGVEILAINGGDGTISRTLTAFVKEYGDAPLPQVALLKGGTINVLANNLGMKGSPEQILFRLTEAFSQGDPLRIRTLSSLLIESNIGFLFGNGSIPLFLKEYYKRKSGPIGAGWWFFRVWLSRFFGSKLYNTVVVDHLQNLLPTPGAPVLHKTIGVFASTLPRTPLGYPLFSKIKGVLRQFQVVSFTCSASEAVWQVPLTLLKNKSTTSRGKFNLVCEKLDVALDEPFPYTLDGELFFSTSNTLALGLGPDINFVLV